MYADLPNIINAIVATGLGLLLGFERAVHHKNASLKTFSLISLGSCIFTQLSLEIASINSTDPARIAAQIVSGIGFVGGGVIFKTSDHVEGITTAVMLWFAASIGMCCGFEKINYAIVITLLYFFIYLFAALFHKIVNKVTSQH